LQRERSRVKLRTQKLSRNNRDEGRTISQTYNILATRTALSMEVRLELRSLKNRYVKGLEE